MRRRQINYQILVAYLLLTIACSLFIWLSLSFIDIYHSQSYQTTKGLIYHSSIIRSTSNPSDEDQGFFDVEIEYQYRVKGTRFQGHRIFAASLPLLTEAKAVQLQSEFALGSVQKIYFDSQTPSQSVLRRNVSETVWYLLGLAVFFFAMGLQLKLKGRQY